MVIHLGLASDGVSIGPPSHSKAIGWVPMCTHTSIRGPLVFIHAVGPPPSEKEKL